MSVQPTTVVAVTALVPIMLGLPHLHLHNDNPMPHDDDSMRHDDDAMRHDDDSMRLNDHSVRDNVGGEPLRHNCNVHCEVCGRGALRHYDAMPYHDDTVRDDHNSVRHNYDSVRHDDDALCHDHNSVRDNYDSVRDDDRRH